MPNVIAIASGKTPSKSLQGTNVRGLEGYCSLSLSLYSLGLVPSSRKAAREFITMLERLSSQLYSSKFSGTWWRQLRGLLRVNLRERERERERERKLEE